MPTVLIDLSEDDFKVLTIQTALANMQLETTDELMSRHPRLAKQEFKRAINAFQRALVRVIDHRYHGLYNNPTRTPEQREALQQLLYPVGELQKDILRVPLERLDDFHALVRAFNAGEIRIED